MINLNKIKITKRSLLDVESDLLLIGFFEEANLSSIRKKLNDAIGNQLINAMEIDNFNGKKDTSMTLYGNDDMKKIHVVGLGKNK